jgi:hypothetical protein
MLDLEPETAVAFGARFESFETRSDDLWPNTISADGRDAMSAHDHSFRVLSDEPDPPRLAAPRDPRICRTLRVRGRDERTT